MKKVSLFVIYLITIEIVNAQNVGIGTTTPAAMLDVQSTLGFTSKFSSTSNQMYIGFFENNQLRGYMGSYSGAAEDVDIGTASANPTGKLHFTIQSTPKMTIINSGNVGIGTTNPVEKLDLTGSMKMTGELKPDGIAGIAGQVLTSKGDGTMLWANTTTSGGGNGGWGDCSIYKIDSYFPVANSNGKSQDYMGGSSAISGNYAIVGASGDDVGFNSNGSATIFKINAFTNEWESQGKILNINPANQDNFGSSVSISGNYAIVGASSDDEGGFTDNGSATIFLRNSTTGVWEPVTKLTNQNPANTESFGCSVSISGDYAIVGAMTDTEGGLSWTGSASIYKRNAGTGAWEFQVKLLNPSNAADDRFGSAVSIFGDYAIVGSSHDDENTKTNNGSATIYKRNTGTGIWEMQVKLSDSSPSNDDLFGYSVSISGDLVIIGTFLDDENGLIDCGSATIYKRNTSTNIWESQGKFTNGNGGNDDYFGASVSINNDFVMIGSSAEDFSGFTDLGSVTLLKRYENVWISHQKFSLPSGANYSLFGGSVSIDPAGSRFLIGAPGFSSAKGLAFFGKARY
ncbi:MAG: FG-GAP repeat protein [Bacteroidota bacterium]